MSSDEGSDQEDTTISNPAVIEKYKLSAKIANAALQRVVEQLGEGKSLLEIAEASDKFIIEQTNQYFKKAKIEKGIAFPTCLSVNHVVGHYSPEVGDKTTLKSGDVVKIDLGAHLDGYIAVAAHTHVVGNSQFAPATGKAADAICAAHLAGEAVLRLLKPGNKNTDVAPLVQTICETFHVNTVEAVLSHHMEHHVIDGTKVIPNKLVPDQAVEEFTFAENDVYAIDIVVSTGTGKTREQELRPAVYKRDVDKTYLLKLQAARKILTDISKKSPTLPFSIRSLEDKHARFGLSELEKHDLVHPYPILYEKPGEIVAQFKYTAFIGPNGALRITGLPLPFVQSQYAIEEPRVKELLNQEVVFRNKKPVVVPTQKETTKPQEKENPDVTPMETN